MGILKTLKEIFIPGSVFAEINEENLRAQKMKLGMTEYKRWLKKKRVIAEAVKRERKEKWLNIPDSWTEKINLLEREMKEAERF